MRPTQRQLKAMAYSIADEIETRAAQLRKVNPRLSRDSALIAAIHAMAGGA